MLTKVSISLHRNLEIFYLFCVLNPILLHLVMSSLHNLYNRHNTKILNISGTRGNITKRKTPFFFIFKGLSNKLIFQYRVLLFHRHFKRAPHCISSYFDHVQNYLEIEGNLKIVEIIINHKGTRMVKDGED